MIGTVEWPYFVEYMNLQNAEKKIGYTYRIMSFNAFKQYVL